MWQGVLLLRKPVRFDKRHLLSQKGDLQGFSITVSERLCKNLGKICDPRSLRVKVCPEPLALPPLLLQAPTRWVSATGLRDRLPALPAGPAAFSDLRKLPLEAWGSQQIKVMGKKSFKTKPCVTNIMVCSKQTVKGTEVSYLGLKRSTLVAFKAWQRCLPQGPASSLNSS